MTDIDRLAGQAIDLAHAEFEAGRHDVAALIIRGASMLSRAASLKGEKDEHGNHEGTRQDARATDDATSGDAGSRGGG